MCHFGLCGPPLAMHGVAMNNSEHADHPTRNQQKTVASHSDLIIVGAGIIGLAHAAEAVSRGLSVTIIDRDTRAVGASIRNFGHACVTAQTGELLSLARTAREGWLKHSSLAGFFSVESGGLAVARSQAEMAILEEVASTRQGDFDLIDAQQVKQELAGSADSKVVGGAYLLHDVRVDPREAVTKLAAWLATQPRITFMWQTSYFGSEEAATGVKVSTSRGTLAAAKVLICVGHDLDYLFPEIANQHEIKRCSLQMALVKPADNYRINRAVLSGTSMLRYGAFAKTSAAVVLRKELEQNAPELLAIDANLMLTQRPDGTLIVGDSHHTELTQAPFLTEQTSQTLIDATAALLGNGNFTVLQRWQGIYASSPQQDFLIENISSNVTAVSVTSGIGMTISFGLARKTLDLIDSTPNLPAVATSR